MRRKFRGIGTEIGFLNIHSLSLRVTVATYVHEDGKGMNRLHKELYKKAIAHFT